MAEPIKRIASRFAVNEFVAARLREAADLLAAQQDNPFRVLAYRRAAESIASLDHSVEELEVSARFVIFLYGSLDGS